MDNAEIASIARARNLIASGDGRRIRERHRLSLRDVSRALGINPSTIHRWETGEQRPRAESALLYAELLSDVEHSLSSRGATCAEAPLHPGVEADA